MFLIRPATANDMPAVLNLIQELADFENQPNQVQITVADLIQDGFGTNPLFYVYLAQVNNTIVGMALYYYRYSTWKGKTIHLEDLIVSKNSRGKGIGFALYSQIINLAKKQNIRRVEWQVLNWNQEAIQFYKKTGAQIFEDWQVVQMNQNTIQLFGTDK